MLKHLVLLQVQWYNEIRRSTLTDKTFFHTEKSHRPRTMRLFLYMEVSFLLMYIGLYTVFCTYYICVLIQIEECHDRLTYEIRAARK